MKKLTAILLTGAIAASLSACSTQAEEPASLGMDLSQYTVVDISHLQEADMPADPSLQLPQSDFFGRIGVDGGLHNLEVLSYCVHTGTHMDAPYHVIETGGGIDTVDPLILIGPACVVKLDVPAGSYGITVDDVKAWEELLLIGTVQLPDTAADKVALHSVAQLHASGNAQPALVPPCFAAVDHKIGGHRAFPFVVQAAEFMILFQ